MICYGFIKALKEITDEIASVERNEITVQDARTRALACDIYAQFFIFYRNVLRWFTAKSVVRAWRSINTDLHDELYESVKEVQRTAALITRHDLIRHGQIQVDMEKATHQSLQQLKQYVSLIAKQQRLVIDGMLEIRDDQSSLRNDVSAISRALAKLICMMCEDRGTAEFWRKFARLKQNGYISEPETLEGTLEELAESEDNLEVREGHSNGCEKQPPRQKSKST
jgi:predicted protein tyrosine phosphatase